MEGATTTTEIPSTPGPLTMKSEESGKTYPRHPSCHATGGLILHDEGNIMGSALKDILGKVAKKMAKG